MSDPGFGPDPDAQDEGTGFDTPIAGAATYAHDRATGTGRTADWMRRVSRLGLAAGLAAAIAFWLSETDDPYAWLDASLTFAKSGELPNLNSAVAPKPHLPEEGLTDDLRVLLAAAQAPTDDAPSTRTSDHADSKQPRALSLDELKELAAAIESEPATYEPWTEQGPAWADPAKSDAPSLPAAPAR
jgi:hypothetical protein